MIKFLIAIITEAFQLLEVKRKPSGAWISILFSIISSSRGINPSSSFTFKF